MFPVVLLLIFATVFGDQTVNIRGGIKTATYYVPAIITLSVISATMQNLAMSLTIAREDGRLKRGRGTPMPAWVFIAGRVGNAIVVSLMMLACWRRSAASSTGSRSLGPAPGDPGDARRRGRVVLLPGGGADGLDPVTGRRRADRQRNRCSPSTSSPACSSPTTRFPTASSTSPTSSRSGRSSRPSSPHGFPRRGAGFDWEQPRRRRGLGRGRLAASPFAISAGPRDRLSRRRRHVSALL